MHENLNVKGEGTMMEIPVVVGLISQPQWPNDHLGLDLVP